MSTIVCPQCAFEAGAEDQFCGRCGFPMQVVGTTSSPLFSRLAPSLEPDFELVRELGRGGMATVFLANDTALKRPVAIKVLSGSARAGWLDRFRQEAITLAGLDHPNIVRIFGIRSDGDLHCLVMQYVDGTSLDSLIRTGGLPIQQVVGILQQTAGALDYAHERGVVHRDVKPANILVDRSGRAFVADFGIAKLLDTGPCTATGLVMGTVAYMSPEQCDGRTVSGASDQYSLGVVGYEMLTGTAPFTGITSAILAGHLVGRPARVEMLRPEAPGWLVRSIGRMMAKRAEDRWLTCSVGMTVPSSYRRQRFAPFAAAALVVALGLGLLWRAWESGRRVPPAAERVTGPVSRAEERAVRQEGPSPEMLTTAAALEKAAGRGEYSWAVSGLIRLSGSVDSTLAAQPSDSGLVRFRERLSADIRRARSACANEQILVESRGGRLGCP